MPKKPHKSQKADKAEEPASHYKTVRIFHSFEEANEADAKEMAALSPVQRIKNTVELILRVYGQTRENLAKRKKTYRVEILNK